jgi:hypothetical protein
MEAEPTEKGFKNRDVRLSVAYFVGFILLGSIVESARDLSPPALALGIMGVALIGELVLGVFAVRAAIRYYRSSR